VDPRTFVIASVPVRFEAALRRALAGMHAPFFVRVGSSDLTLVAAQDEWRDVRGAFPGATEEAGYRLVTLDIPLEWQVVGYLAAVTRALADGGVPAGGLSSFHHDHLLIRGDVLPEAEAALRHLIDTAGAAAADADRDA
jgi:hypothetical protein